MANPLEAIDSTMRALGASAGLNIVENANQLSVLNAALWETSVRMKSLGVDFETVKERAILLSDRFNLSAESLIKLQRTATYGFSGISTNVDSLNNMLAVSERLFGRNEKSAEAFVDSLASLSESSRSYRDYLIQAVDQEGQLLS